MFRPLWEFIIEFEGDFIDHGHKMRTSEMRLGNGVLTVDLH